MRYNSIKAVHLLGVIFFWQYHCDGRLEGARWPHAKSARHSLRPAPRHAHSLDLYRRRGRAHLCSLQRGARELLALQPALALLGNCPDRNSVSQPLIYGLQTVR